MIELSASSVDPCLSWEWASGHEAKPDPRSAGLVLVAGELLLHWLFFPWESFLDSSKDTAHKHSSSMEFSLLTRFWWL
jgi:hypothetical protein